MNKTALKNAEKEFFQKWPGGFDHPDLVAVGKKHKMESMVEFAKKGFGKKAFDNPNLVVSAWSKLVTRSSMISMFDKPKTRDGVENMSARDRLDLADALYQVLHGAEKRGFETMCEILARHKLAKWPLMTVAQTYYKPDKGVFVKPTTVKQIIESLDLNLVYKPQPSWEFYKQFRDEVSAMKKATPRIKTPYNAAYLGFLMMTL